MRIRTLKEPGYEEVLRCEDNSSGLTAFIAVHNTHLGPALGGIRMHAYSSDQEALQDVLRLARAMTYKNAAAHLKLGGAKSVIIGDPSRDKNPKMLQVMGKFVDHLNGRYYAAKDAGIFTQDLVVMAKETKWMTGLPETMGGSGDPSPWTSRGIIEGLRVCVGEQLGTSKLKDVHVAIQGVGHVGYELGKILREEGAKLTVSDVNPEMVKRAVTELGAISVDPQHIFSTKCDVLAPCALGGAVNDATIGKLKCKIIAGGANNQLEDEAKHGNALFKRCILYAPDYVLNAGGVMNIFSRDILKEEDSMPWIRKIGDYLTEIFSLSKERKLPPAQISDELTEKILSRLT